LGCESTWRWLAVWQQSHQRGEKLTSVPSWFVRLNSCRRLKLQLWLLYKSIVVFSSFLCFQPSPQDPEDLLHLSYNKCRGQDSVRMSPAFQHCNRGFFGHIARSAPDEDHQHAVAAAIHKPPSDWKRPPGRPNHTWLRAIESDLRPLNIGLSYAWKKTASQDH